MGKHLEHTHRVSTIFNCSRKSEKKKSNREEEKNEKNAMYYKISDNLTTCLNFDSISINKRSLAYLCSITYKSLCLVSINLCRLN